MSNKCPKCDYKKLKTWQELTADEKFIVKLKESKFKLEQIKTHRFCVRCGFEEVNEEMRV